MEALVLVFAAPRYMRAFAFFKPMKLWGCRPGKDMTTGEKEIEILAWLELLGWLLAIVV